MKSLLVLLVLVPLVGMAKSPFDGTWKTRKDSIQMTGKPDVFSLGNGMYECRSCAPAYQIKADGTDQPVPGHSYVDHEAVSVQGPMSVAFTDKKAGKVMSTQTMTVSADGGHLTTKWTSYVGEKPISGSQTEKRVAPAAAGAHAISGSWMLDSVAEVSDAALTTVLQSTDNGMRMVWNGQTTDARFDGKEYPTMGDAGKTMVSLKKISDYQMEETDRRLGKVTDVTLWTAAKDGKTLSAVDTDPQHGTKTSWVADRMP